MQTHDTKVWSGRELAKATEKDEGAHIWVDDKPAQATQSQNESHRATTKWKTMRHGSERIDHVGNAIRSSFVVETEGHLQDQKSCNDGHLRPSPI